VAEAIDRLIQVRVQDALARQQGANRAYAWQAGDPTADPAPEEPAPFMVELPSKPLEVVASCRTAPTSDLTVQMRRSMDGGAIYLNMLATPVVIPAGATFGSGAIFNWENPVTRDLVPPGTVGARLMHLLPGDLIIPVLTGGAGVRGFSAQVRVERLAEHVRKGRA
jgi:hypothetical protein